MNTKLSLLPISLILLVCGNILNGQDVFPYFGWELGSYNYTIPFAESPSSFSKDGSASSAKISPAVVMELEADRLNDNLPLNGIYGKGWPQALTLDSDKYIEFSISPNTSDPIYVGSITLPFFQEIKSSGKGEGGPRRWALRWSVDEFSSNITPEIQISSSSANQEILKDIDLWQLGPTYGTITFRLYGYDAPSPEGSGGLRVVSKKLYIRAANRPPLFGISPTVPLFTGGSQVGTYRITLKASYGDSFDLEYSYDLSTWIKDPVPPVIINDIDNEIVAISSVHPTGTSIFFRFKRRD